ncbi:hypothetical protein A3D00_04195 [Candidatus Woesebacteria bacterium RIFCSPHIGHO2_02_FULL_38_9]|uniref:Nudix hydrolase domain-containing protein n=1 Tax=Candidatus Woesebacteria bacterium RIFCSPHIGHO2_01_FULL_39_28 TaxID=1802496 RepID=A0A1F7YCJ2_9BACT|nr:MAG: hypothetical protein A2627_05085 [Candidatus Woesebacteria bacterium RIFCSPHIGHO2_01_FULL_39_28]OGM33765.1 MAG: hypothetical protein A3D00_04195 [Candidatus Woesebacteria bacterium RIFCSPHIGHO2_02_FULL_38_9]OGM57567.1 MAG: hypothetical protein A3A50_06200 [Candidatus Woesebacteria bacterium RIFCSPLOWO2_01_FULL_38_20]
MINKEETTIGTHCILVTSEGEIILQQRTIDPNIVNSGKIAMFGGTIKTSENLIKGLRRELLEELDLDINEYNVEKLGTYYKTQKLDGIDYTIHVFLVNGIKESDLKLHEGAGFAKGKIDTLLKNPNITRITRLALKDLQKNSVLLF